MRQRKDSKEGGWNCNICNLNFRTRKELQKHQSITNHYISGSNKGGPVKGNFYCKFCNKLFNSKGGNTKHEKHCPLNPNRIPGHSMTHTEEHKKYMSLKQKEIWASGNRKFNDGFSMRKKGIMSWPEKWWTEVIQNEFNDKNVKYELRQGRYLIDFAWEHKLLAIEIDGAQHKRPERIEIDKRKDKYLKSKGWHILRIDWKECFNNPKKYIELAKNFIGN